MTDWNADDAPVELGGGGAKDQLTTRSMAIENAYATSDRTGNFFYFNRS